MLGEHTGQPDVVIGVKSKRDGALIERGKGNKRREFGVRGSTFAGLVGHVREPERASRPPGEVGHHVLAVDPVVDRKILQ